MLPASHLPRPPLLSNKNIKKTILEILLGYGTAYRDRINSVLHSPHSKTDLGVSTPCDKSKKLNYGVCPQIDVLFVDGLKDLRREVSSHVPVASGVHISIIFSAL